MLGWMVTTLILLVVSVASVRTWWRERKRRLAAERRIVEPPNSYFASKDVQDQEDLEWWSQIRTDALHEVNREYVERLLSRIRADGVDSLNREERAFLERMAHLEAPPRLGARPPQDPWPRPA